MHSSLNGSDKIREAGNIDLVFMAKLFLALAVVGGGLFHLGLNIGKGEMVRPAQASSRIDPTILGYGAEGEQIEQVDPLFSFPSLLTRRNDESLETDQLLASLSEILSLSMDDQKEKEAGFEKRRALGILASKYDFDPRVDLEEIDGESFADKMETLIEASSARGEAGRELFAIPGMPIESKKDGKQKTKKRGSRFGKYTLQLQSFQSSKEATAFHKLMIEKGYNPFIQKAKLGKRGLWHRVRLGRFVDAKSADKFKAKFEKKEGLATRVMPL